MILRTSLDEIGGWSENRYILEDWDLSFRMIANGMRILFQPEALTRFRRDDHGSITADLAYDLIIHLTCIQEHRRLITDTVGSDGLRRLRARYLHRFGRRLGRVSGRLIAWGALLYGR
jgi:hypothetical protein